MTEVDPVARSWDLEGAPSTAEGTVRISALVRGTDPRGRAECAVRRLLRLVAEWGPDTALDITYGATRRRGNHADLRVHGAVPLSWEEDLRWAWQDVATLRRGPCQVAVCPARVLELVARRASTPRSGMGRPADRDLPEPELSRQTRLRAEVPWPVPLHADLADVLSLNVAARSPGLVLRYRLSGTSPLEDEMLRGDLLHSYLGQTELQDYLGRPVRLRAFVGAPGPVPARARALVAEWGTHLGMIELPGSEAERAWSGDALSLAGYAVPHGTALACLRVPVAGPATFPGMATSRSELPDRPLDPVPPPPRRAVRLGRAHSAGQEWVASSVELDDLLHHTFVQGASGSGKSTLLATIATGVLDAGGGVTLLDPEGSTVDLVLQHLRPEHAARTRVVRHGTHDLDAPLNLLTGAPEQRERMVELFAEMIQRAQDPRQDGMVGPRWKRWFSLTSLATATLLGDRASLVAVAAIASDMGRVRGLATALKAIDPELAHRLNQEYGRLEGKEALDLVSWAMSKLQEIISSERARWIFGAGSDGVDVARTLDEGGSLLVDLGAHRLGEPTGRAIGATYLLKHWAAMSGRRDRRRPHVIVVDEAHLFSYGVLPKLLAEARKFGIGVVVATQHLGQLTGELADALESNTGAFVSLRSGLQSAARASVRLDGWPTGELVRLPDLTAAATLTRNGVVSPPFTLHLDQHARARRLTRSGVLGPHVAEQVLAVSREEARRFAELKAPTDAELCRRLEPVRRPRPRPPQEEDDDINSWLARNRA